MWLGIDTSTSYVSLALAEGGERHVVEERVEGPPAKQSALLPEMIHALLASRGVKVSALQGIVVGRGPGSFTGLRVGLATVKGLAYAAKLEVVAVSSLAAVAHDAFSTSPSRSRIAAVAVARRDELYVGLYDRNGQGVTLVTPETSVMISEVPAFLAQYGNPEVAGPALEMYREALTTLGLAPAALLPGQVWPSARALLALAQFEGRFNSEALFALEPHYVKTSGAEQNPKFPPLPGQAPTARIRED